MKSSLRLNLLSVTKRSLLGFAAAVAAVLALESAVLAAPIPLDIYQDMESGSNGNVLTAAIMNASNHGAYGWQATSGTMWVSTKYPKDLPGPVSVGGVTYNGTGGTRTWKVNNNNIQNYVQVGLSGSGYTYITIACYYATETTIGSRQQYDAIVMFGNKTFCVMQNVMDDLNGPYLRSHSNVSGVTHYGPNIRISDGKPYWINLHFDGNAPTASLAVYDPDNGFAQVGSTSVCPSTQDVMTWKCMFGRQDNHGNESRDTTQSWYDHICVDYTNHIFPLIPSAGTDTTPPSAPGTVRDGTGTDISTTGSTVQLSANWDASSDAQSGISGYQYAIGTSVGGTQTVNWTSLGNVTTVTKTGLTLTVGQTYYFSVKAVNGVGLTGSATNSNGQTVVSSATTYFQDTFESWAVHGGGWSSTSGESVNHTLNTSTDYARAGTKSLKLTDTDTTATAGACLVKNFSPVITTDIYVRFYVFLPTGFNSTNTNCNRRLLRVWCGSNRSQITIRPLATVMEEVGAWGAATGPALSENAWHAIELHVAPPSSSTALQFWIDGTSAGTLTANYSPATSFSYMEFGDVSMGSGNNGTGTFYLDDVVASDAYNGLLP